MKKIYGFAALAALALTSCSNENEPANIDHGTGEKMYIAVNLVNPSAKGTKANAGGYEPGSEVENAVTSAKFVFLKSGKVTDVVSKDLDFKELGDYGNTVATESKPIMLVTNADSNDTPDEVIALLNYGGTFEVTTTSKADVLATVADYAAQVKATPADGDFVMSNSVYNDGTSNVQTTKITPANFYKTENLAKGNPVDIYVERIVAKVSTTKNEGFGDCNVTANAEAGAKAAYLKIDGVEVANAAANSYLVKSLDGITNPFLDWNDFTNFRSYWAKSSATKWNNQSWNDIESTSALSAQTFYINENTVSAVNNQSMVLITGHLCESDETTPLQLVRYAGDYYTPADGLKAIAGAFNGAFDFGVKTTDGTIDYVNGFDYSDFEWATSVPDANKVPGANYIPGYYGVIKLKTTFTGDIVKKDGGNWIAATAADVNAALLAEAYRAWKWTDGACYYYVPIQHLAADNINGVVRNHVYKINLKSVNGLGVPVFDKDRVIIPETPTDGTYQWNLAASVKILKWAIKSQDANFGTNY